MNERRRFEQPDEVVEFGGVTEELISIGGLTVSRSTQPAGWRWSEHFRPLVGGERCQAHHVGIVLSGRQGIELEDGTTFELGTGDLYDLPPGHDGWTIGDESTVMLEWSGMRSWVGGSTHRALVGVSVHEAARIMAEAGPGEILVSEPVELVCRASGVTFADAGEHELRGVPGRWRLYRVVD